MCDDKIDNTNETIADVLDEIETIIEANDLVGFIQLANKEHASGCYVFPKWCGLKGNNLSITFDTDVNSIEDERLEDALNMLYSMASITSSGLRQFRKLINEIHDLIDTVED